MFVPRSTWIQGDPASLSVSGENSFNIQPKYFTLLIEGFQIRDCELVSNIINEKVQPEVKNSEAFVQFIYDSLVESTRDAIKSENPAIAREAIEAILYFLKKVSNFTLAPIFKEKGIPVPVDEFKEYPAIVKGFQSLNYDPAQDPLTDRLNGNLVTLFGKTTSMQADLASYFKATSALISAGTVTSFTKALCEAIKNNDFEASLDCLEGVDSLAEFSNIKAFVQEVLDALMEAFTKPDTLKSLGKIIGALFKQKFSLVSMFETPQNLLEYLFNKKDTLESNYQGYPLLFVFFGRIGLEFLNKNYEIIIQLSPGLTKNLVFNRDKFASDIKDLNYLSIKGHFYKRLIPEETLKEESFVAQVYEALVVTIRKNPSSPELESLIRAFSEGNLSLNPYLKTDVQRTIFWLMYGSIQNFKLLEHFKQLAPLDPAKPKSTAESEETKPQKVTHSSFLKYVFTHVAVLADLVSLFPGTVVEGDVFKFPSKMPLPQKDTKFYKERIEGIELTNAHYQIFKRHLNNIPKGFKSFKLDPNLPRTVEVLLDSLARELKAVVVFKDLVPKPAAVKVSELTKYESLNLKREVGPSPTEALKARLKQLEEKQLQLTDETLEAFIIELESLREVAEEAHKKHELKELDNEPVRKPKSATPKWQPKPKALKKEKKGKVEATAKVEAKAKVEATAKTALKPASRKATKQADINAKPLSSSPLTPKLTSADIQLIRNGPVIEPIFYAPDIAIPPEGSDGYASFIHLQEALTEAASLVTMDRLSEEAKSTHYFAMLYDLMKLNDALVGVLQPNQSIYSITSMYHKPLDLRNRLTHYFRNLVSVELEPIEQFISTLSANLEPIMKAKKGRVKGIILTDVPKAFCDKLHDTDVKMLSVHEKKDLIQRLIQEVVKVKSHWLENPKGLHKEHVPGGFSAAKMIISMIGQLSKGVPDLSSRYGSLIPKRNQIAHNKDKEAASSERYYLPEDISESEMMGSIRRLVGKK